MFGGYENPGVSMKLRDILTKDPEVISPDAMICEAARKMKAHDIGMLPVCDGERLVGAITDRDLTIRAVAEGSDPLNTKVRDVMTPHICYCFDDQDLEEAANQMEEKQIRRLAVLNRDKRLVGIVSLGDFAVRSKDEHLTEEVLECVSQPA
jgi:CBS domain-containing protein